MFQQTPDLSIIHNFGAKCWSYIERNNQGKIASKAIKCIFLRYTEGSTIYKLYDLKNRKLIQSMDVEFYRSNSAKSCTDTSIIYIEENKSEVTESELTEDQEPETDESTDSDVSEEKTQESE